MAQSVWNKERRNRAPLSSASTPGSSHVSVTPRGSAEHSAPSVRGNEGPSKPPSSTSNRKPLSADATVKDLSDLFDFSHSQSARPSAIRPTKSFPGVAKRMLRRTHTDSSIGPSTSNNDETYPQRSSTPHNLVAEGTEPLIDVSHPSPSGSGSRQLTPTKSGSLEDHSVPLTRPSIPAASSIRTYGGKSRSFLVSLPNAGSALLSLDANGNRSQNSQSQGEVPGFGENEEDDLEIRESYTDLIARWGVEEEDVYPTWSPPGSPSGKTKPKGKGKHVPPAAPLPPGMMNDLKSISELRSKGEVRRFLDDMGYLFEGLDPKGAINVRRGRWGILSFYNIRRI